MKNNLKKKNHKKKNRGSKSVCRSSCLASTSSSFPVSQIITENIYDSRCAMAVASRPEAPVTCDRSMAATAAFPDTNTTHYCAGSRFIHSTFVDIIILYITFQPKYIKYVHSICVTTLFTASWNSIVDNYFQSFISASPHLLENSKAYHFPDA